MSKQSQNKFARTEKRLKSLRKKLEDRLEKTDSAFAEMKKISNELIKIEKGKMGD
jgi:hypothetical protein